MGKFEKWLSTLAATQPAQWVQQTHLSLSLYVNDKQLGEITKHTDLYLDAIIWNEAAWSNLYCITEFTRGLYWTINENANVSEFIRKAEVCNTDDNSLPHLPF